LRAARNTAPDYETNQGHVLIALRNAFYQALHAPTVEEGVVATVMGAVTPTRTRPSPARY